jgi:3-oxoadipate enol-lactonase
MLPHHVVTGPAGAPVLVLSNSLSTTYDLWEPQVRSLSDELVLAHLGVGGDA